MMKYDAEVAVRDVNPTNAEIYTKGQMYICAAKSKKHPMYFAPYFTNDNILPGIYCLSSVMEVGCTTVADIQNHKAQKKFEKRFANSAEFEYYWNNYWRRGFKLLSKRGKDENWEPDEKNLLLYFLDRPIILPRQPLLKATDKIRQLPAHYSLSLGQLLTLTEISEGVAAKAK